MCWKDRDNNSMGRSTDSSFGIGKGVEFDLIGGVPVDRC